MKLSPEVVIGVGVSVVAAAGAIMARNEKSSKGAEEKLGSSANYLIETGKAYEWNVRRAQAEMDSKIPMLTPELQRGRERLG